MPDCAAINFEIHDGYFDVAELSHDPGKEEVRVPIYRGQWTKRLIGWTGRGPNESETPFAELVIRRVLQMTVEDNDIAGWVSIKGVAFDEAQTVVRLSGNIPVEVRCSVRAFDVDLVDQ